MSIGFIRRLPALAAVVGTLAAGCLIPVTASAATSKPVDVFIGDSIVASNPAVKVDETNRWSKLVADADNALEVNVAIGGTGFIEYAGSTYSNQTDTALKRVTAAGLTAKDVRRVYLVGGGNDLTKNGVTASSIAKEVKAMQETADKIKSTFPNAQYNYIPEVIPQTKTNTTRVNTAKPYLSQLYGLFTAKGYNVAENWWDWLPDAYTNGYAAPDDVHTTPKAHNVAAHRIVEWTNTLGDPQVTGSVPDWSDGSANTGQPADQVTFPCTASGNKAKAPEAQSFCWIDWNGIDLTDTAYYTTGRKVAFTMPGGRIEGVLKLEKSTNANPFTKAENSYLRDGYQLSDTGHWGIYFQETKNGNKNEYVTINLTGLTAVADRDSSLSDWDMAFADAEVMSGTRTYYEKTTISSDKTIRELGMYGVNTDAKNSYQVEHSLNGSTLTLAGGGPCKINADGTIALKGGIDSCATTIAAASMPTRFTTRFEHVNTGGNSTSAVAIGFHLPHTTFTHLTYEANANGVAGQTGAQTVQQNTTTTVAKNGFTRPGYTFNGWNTKADGTGTTMQPGDRLTLAVNTTLYAQWRKTTQPATVSYHKRIEPANGKTNEYELALDASSSSWATSTQSDVVFVLDRSGSMRWRIDKDEDPGKGSSQKTRGSMLVASLQSMTDRIGEWNSRHPNARTTVSLVTFSNTASTIQEWTDDMSLVKTAAGKSMDNLSSDMKQGTTNWQAGLAQADQLLQSRGDDGHRKILVFLTDGQPTTYLDDQGTPQYCPSATANMTCSDQSFVTRLTDATVNQARLIGSHGYVTMSVGIGPQEYLTSNMHRVESLMEGGDGTGTPARYFAADSETGLDDAMNEAIATSTASPLRITDTLTQWVEFTSTDPKTVSVLENGKTLDSNLYETSFDGRTVTVEFNPDAKLTPDATVTVRFPVRVSQAGRDKAAKDGLTDTGDKDTGSKSSGMKGLYSNSRATLTVTNGDGNTLGYEYPRPVVQPVSAATSSLPETGALTGILTGGGDGGSRRPAHRISHRPTEARTGLITVHASMTREA